MASMSTEEWERLGAEQAEHANWFRQKSEALDAAVRVMRMREWAWTLGAWVVFFAACAVLWAGGQLTAGALVAVMAAVLFMRHGLVRAYLVMLAMKTVNEIDEQFPKPESLRRAEENS